MNPLLVLALSTGWNFLGVVEEVKVIDFCRVDITVFKIAPCSVKDQSLPFRHGFGLVGTISSVPVGEEIFIKTVPNDAFYISTKDQSQVHKLLFFGRAGDISASINHQQDQ